MSFRHLTSACTDCVGWHADKVLWVNDLERDADYRSWPSKLEQLLMPLFGGERLCVCVCFGGSGGVCLVAVFSASFSAEWH